MGALDVDTTPPGTAVHSPAGQLSEENTSKDAFFVKLGQLAEAMIARHGKDFAMGTLVLSARFIAENKPLIRRSGDSGS